MNGQHAKRKPTDHSKDLQVRQPAVKLTCAPTDRQLGIPRGGAYTACTVYCEESNPKSASVARAPPHQTGLPHVVHPPPWLASWLRNQHKLSLHLLGAGGAATTAGHAVQGQQLVDGRAAPAALAREAVLRVKGVATVTGGAAHFPELVVAHPSCALRQRTC
eukprot:350561-Chlamydomonas_euryale.AAC.20